MRKIKNVSIRLICIILSVVLFFGCYIGFYFIQGYAEQFSPSIFQNDYVELKQVADYFLSLDEYEFTSITNKADSFTITGGSKIQIQEEEICDAISNLFQKGYDRIVKFQNQGVYFHRWSNSFHGRFKGFAFHPRSSEEFPVPFVVKKKQMSRPEWYYYESDYNKWRISQPQI